MDYTFDYNQCFPQRIAKGKFEKVLSAISQSTSSFFAHAKFSSQKEYSQFLFSFLSEIKQMTFPTVTQKIYDNEIHQREKKTPLIEKTPWGLVSIKKVDVQKNYVQKLLVIKQFGILGFEYHKKKLEKLKVLEGIALFIFANHTTLHYKKGRLMVQVAGAGNTFQFEPYDEHGLVALTNVVIEETSTNHLDDLHFIFNSEQVVKL